ncbi:hypothetical protein B1207_07150 [Legionella quinlivanii]|uniref:Uncharacterized protein n=1 Tax=Legionella quinlivanii TaxID=45073 RepID=A0A364LJ72_9GAMM|nr:hypothetical protein B1207_07150 [Legionella quinlivanii]
MSPTSYQAAPPRINRTKYTQHLLTLQAFSYNLVDLLILLCFIWLIKGFLTKTNTCIWKIQFIPDLLYRIFIMLSC